MVWKTQGNKKEKNFPILEVMEKEWKEMHRALIMKAFAKAELELIANNNTNPTKTKMAHHLEDYLFTTHNYPYSYKSLVTLYNDAQVEEEEVIIKKPEIVNLLCKYLDFADFNAFSTSVKEQFGRLDEQQKEIAESETQETESVAVTTSFRKLPTYQLFILIAFILGTGSLVLYQFYDNNADQRWLRWNNDHYEEVVFNTADFNNGTLKLYAPELLEFRKIQVDSNTEFFNNKGVPVVWYFKHASGTVEFFDGYHLHPTKDKYVKPVTPYIINKYVLNKH